MEELVEDKELIVTLTFTNEEGTSENTLSYRILPSALQMRWYHLIRTVARHQFRVEGGGHLFGPRFYSEQECIDHLIECVDYINAHSPEKIPMSVKMGFNRDETNRLHEYFEQLGNAPWYSSQDQKLQTMIHDLNIWIHRYEVHLVDAADHHIDIMFQPPLKFALTEEDLKLFTPDFKRNTLYLSYAWVGVPVLPGFYNKVEGKVTPQPIYSSGLFAWFGHTAKFNQWEEMRAWAKETHGIDVDDPKMAIGYLPVGEPVEEFPEDIIEKISKHRVMKSIHVTDPAHEKVIAEPKGRRYRVEIEHKKGTATGLFQFFDCRHARAWEEAFVRDVSEFEGNCIGQRLEISGAHPAELPDVIESDDDYYTLVRDKDTLYMEGPLAHMHEFEGSREALPRQVKMTSQVFMTSPEKSDYPWWDWMKWWGSSIVDPSTRMGALPLGKWIEKPDGILDEKWKSLRWKWHRLD
jgi:acyl carrier protein phosphodiesterase